MKEELTATLIRGLNLQISLIAPGVQSEAKEKENPYVQCRCSQLLHTTDGTPSIHYNHSDHCKEREVFKCQFSPPVA